MKKGRQSFLTDRPVYVRSGYTIVGPKEGDGLYAGTFDTVLKDDLWGEKSYEKAESKMHREAIRGAICLAGLDFDGIDLMLAGDLLNEISASSLAMRYFKVPFVGLYNACSTFSEGMLVGAALIYGGAAKTVTCSTSSHYASAERQYRYPLELGNQRTPTSQWTVTGAGCTVLSGERPTPEDDTRNRETFSERLKEMRANCARDESEEERGSDGKKGLFDPIKEVFNPENGAKTEYRGECEGENTFDSDKNSPLKKLVRGIKRRMGEECEPVCDTSYRRTHIIRIAGGTFGKVVDFGIDDESNMGGAMAPAAADTLIRHFEDTNTAPEDYDAIFTGDLGRFGSEAFCYILGKEGIRLGTRYADCGAGYYAPKQETYQGGSGAGCVNTVFNGMIAKRMERGELRRVLVLATGALLSKDTPLQKETIPGVSHAFVAVSEEY